MRAPTRFRALFSSLSFCVCKHSFTVQDGHGACASTELHRQDSHDMEEKKQAGETLLSHLSAPCTLVSHDCDAIDYGFRSRFPFPCSILVYYAVSACGLIINMPTTSGGDGGREAGAAHRAHAGPFRRGQLGGRTSGTGLGRRRKTNSARLDWDRIKEICEDILYFCGYKVFLSPSSRRIFVDINSGPPLPFVAMTGSREHSSSCLNND
jgi:hypothetical protein